MRTELGEHFPWAAWEAFAASWDDLHVDTHMADGGRYRRRRHARFTAAARGELVRAPHGPHFQALAYNPLHGGTDRWFSPITDEIGASGAMAGILAWSRDLFEAVSQVRTWLVEVHQFRIEARAGEAGLPTPEGVHRDGVDHVLVLLVRRTNIASGTTTIHRPDGAQLGSFTLAAPFDSVVLDDARVFHGVTPVEPIDPAAPAYRDVLVVTFARMV
ncbi:MAG: 2OG-Fe dioxygenase family protein [Deltaproteobacteria bacterium]|nr:2OG-Fe dioxygenase family protein [Deltaproteobacteria bacterium]MCW5803589.1 2OG-Fe dioxygenase family protein [Deltaproteobacteria bacterium]